MKPENATEYVKAQGVGEVPICDMESDANLLYGVDGRVFCEVETNIWANRNRREGVAYLGTGRHGGGIVLRPLFVEIDGEWFNATTGKPTPFVFPDWYERDVSTEDSMADGDLRQCERPLAELNWRQRCEGLVVFSESLCWSCHLKDVYRHVCEAAVKVFRCSEAHIHLMALDGSQFVKYANSTNEPPTYQWEGSRSSSLGRMQRMIDQHKPIVMDYEHPHFEDISPTSFLKLGYKSSVAIPLLANDEVVGMLTIVYRVQTEWSDEDLSYLLLVGRTVGTSVKRIQDTKKAEELSILDERRDLSTEIHDNVSSLIGALSVTAGAALASFEEGDMAATKADLDRLEKTAGMTMRAMRDEMFSLRIPLEDTDGFINGVEDALTLFEENWKIKTELDASQVTDSLVVPLHVSMQLTRILNECLSNTLKHANASCVKVRIADSTSSLSMVVEDDGIGFDVNVARPEKFGLKIMQERAAIAGGKIVVMSDKEEGGTVVRIDVEKKNKRFLE